MSARNQGSDSYRVLARVYRPRRFADLIGQDALTRIFLNAFAMNRVAHAFIFAGVRGVGKTTTARILASALNCDHPGEDRETSAEPCGQCKPCLEIKDGRHIDVTELDAASRTGVDDMRQVIETVHYRPVMARYRVIILDEAHMLSRNAFNALLKTLEEPPPHATFILATTEPRKLPPTILSRCQRFDLRRVGVSVLSDHLSRIAELEEAKIEPEAVLLIAAAADGSVRDGLSLLDQAITLSSGLVTAALLREMLGFGDRLRIFSLLDHTLRGDCPGALRGFDELTEFGTDPLTLLRDLLRLTHELTQMRVASGRDGARPWLLPDREGEQARQLASGLSLASLDRAWRILHRGAEEVRFSPLPEESARMTLIRLAYAADFPDPGALARMLRAGESGAAIPSDGGGGGGGGDDAVRLVVPSATGAPPATATGAPEVPATGAPEVPATLRGCVRLLRLAGEGLLAARISLHARVVHESEGELVLEGLTQGDLRALHGHLGRLTGQIWRVEAGGADDGHPAEVAQPLAAQLRQEIEEHPRVREALSLWDGASVEGAGPGMHMDRGESV